MYNRQEESLPWPGHHQHGDQGLPCRAHRDIDKLGKYRENVIKRLKIRSEIVLVWLSVVGGKEQLCLSVTRPVAVEYIPPKPGLLAVGHMLRGMFGWRRVRRGFL